MRDKIDFAKPETTPGEGSVQERCTLTNAEREAVQFYADAGVYWSTAEGVAHARTLLGLLKRVAL